ncbi:SAM-dependent methyltransferase [Helicobacter sp. 23-1044]
MRFSEYFGEWICAYYAQTPLGRDFYTAVSASRFFGGAIAKYILDLLESGAILLPLNIIDLGANSANLLSDICAFLETLGLGVVEKCNFIAVEANAPELSLRDSQRKSKQSAPAPSFQCKLSPKQSAPVLLLQDSEAVARFCHSERSEESQKNRDFSPTAQNDNDDLAQNNKVIFYKNLAELKNANRYANRHNIFIANEFFDALPCEIIDNDKMAFMQNHRLIFKAHDDKKVQEICKNFKIHKGEIPLIYDEICDEIRAFKFIFIAFDYGNETPRNDFSTRFFYRHKVQNLNDFLIDSALDLSANSANQTHDLPNQSTNLARLFGKCDITYNVPFFVLDRAFERIGATKILSKRQDLALIENFKILDLLQDFYESQNGANRIYLHESNKIKTLLYDLSPKFSTRIYKNF